MDGDFSSFLIELRPSCVRAETGDKRENRLFMAVLKGFCRDDQTRTGDHTPPRRVR